MVKAEAVATAVHRALAREAAEFQRQLSAVKKEPLSKNGNRKPHPVRWEVQRDEGAATFRAVRDRQRSQLKDSFSVVTESHRALLSAVMALTGRKAIDVALAMIRFELFCTEYDPLLIAAAVEIDEAVQALSARN